MSNRVFISYARTDRDYVDRLARAHVTTANFPGNVVCLFRLDGELMDESGQRWGPDESKDSLYWLGIPRADVTVRCDGVEGSLVWS